MKGTLTAYFDGNELVSKFVEQRQPFVKRMCELAAPYLQEADKETWDAFDRSFGGSNATFT